LAGDGNCKEIEKDRDVWFYHMFRVFNYPALWCWHNALDCIRQPSCKTSPQTPQPPKAAWPSRLFFAQKAALAAAQGRLAYRDAILQDAHNARKWLLAKLRQPHPKRRVALIFNYSIKNILV
jgi:hypothetical protein